ncbi:MAG: hypothetical protein R3344_12195, partial [Acidobacteriota bacterium]|nr:hypothetical protein [Acidobacteriota bacterium]
MTGLPGSVRESVDAALHDLGSAPVRSVVPIGGGCINNGARIETADDHSFFLKWNRQAPADLF